MRRSAVEKFVWVARIGADPNDDVDLKLQKSLLVLCSFPFVFAGVAWGLLYSFFGEPLAGASSRTASYRSSVSSTLA